MCEITTSLKKRFCTDNNLSIQIYSEPYFSNRVELFGKLEDWNQFVEMLKDYNTEEDFFAEYNKLKDDAIQYIKSSAAFISINEEYSMLFDTRFNLPDRDTYKEMNVGRKFFSIDMVKANFSCLVYYANTRESAFFNSFVYADFLRQFTNKDYFIRSKYIRQVIFGNCNCKRVIAYEKVMMAKLLDLLLDIKVVKLEDIYSLRADEIIIDITDFTEEQIEKIRLALNNNNIGFPINYEIYRVNKFKNEDAYVKVFDDGTFELKKINIEDAPAVYRYMLGQTSNVLDQYFYHNGRIAYFVEPKKWELEE